MVIYTKIPFSNARDCNETIRVGFVSVDLVEGKIVGKVKYNPKKIFFMNALT